MEPSDNNALFEQPADEKEQTEKPASKRLIAGTFSSISDAELMIATLGSEATDYEDQ